VRTAGLFVLASLSFLFACHPRIPEIPMTAVPAGPLMHELEQHRQNFSNIKAVARMEIEKRGRRRTFDTVGIVVDGQRRLRMEAYGPLGQSLMAVVWDGKDVLLRMPDEDKVVREGPGALERLLGRGVEPSELCAILSGNIPGPGKDVAASQQCSPNGACVLDLREGDDITRRVRVSYSGPVSAGKPRILTYELYRSDKILFRARFDNVEEISGYSVPMRIVIENPDKNLRLTVLYNDMELNTPLSDDAFTLVDETEDRTGK
jgi:outer membrane lipoprotein-sorting protein